ncbi:MAG: methyltransferase domain-containing protein, partial [Cellulosimicrobium funkei]
YDAVTMVAVLHHLELDEALRHARDLLAPGGRLLVVGLARVATPRDLAVDVASALLNPLVGLVKHPRRARPEDSGPDAPDMPVRDPRHTVDEVARTARALLPGARVRRRLFFRYTLEWTAPR